MKKKYFKSFVCLGLGIITLTAAAFANYDNANGYSICKNAAKQFLFETNYTFKTNLKANIDGKEIASYDALYKTAGGCDPYRYTYTTESTLSGDMSGYDTTSYENIQQNDFYLNTHIKSDGTSESYANINYRYDNGESYDGSLIGNRSEMTDKMINFAELLCDAFVGDLKNSIILTDSKNGSATYNITLTNNQMPDLISSGISLLMASAADDFNDTMEYVSENPVDTDIYASEIYLWEHLFCCGNPTLESASGTLKLNNLGLPERANGSVYIGSIGKDNQPHTLEILFSCEIYDYQTTSIEKRDINSINGVVMHQDNGDVVVIKNTSADAEAQAKADRIFEEYASHGYVKAYLKDQNGNILDIREKTEK